MLAFLYLPLLLLAPLFTSAAPRPGGSSYKTTTSVGSHSKRYYPWSNVQWVKHHKAIKADSTVTLSWKGGSGNGYEVYYVPQWEGQDVFESIDIATTTKTTVKWHTPKSSDYPEGTTFILGVRDVTTGPAAVWYDLTGLIPFDRRR